jgi:hypothetical protein
MTSSKVWIPMVVTLLIGAPCAAGCSSDSNTTPAGCTTEAQCQSDECCVAGKCVSLATGCVGASGAGSGTGGATTVGAGGAATTTTGGGASIESGGTNGGDGAVLGTGGALPAGAGGSSSGTGGAGGAPAACLGRPIEPTAGQHCVCQSDCDATDFCIDEASTYLAGGFCGRSCAASPCPTGTTCEQLTQGDVGTSTCLVSCKTTSDCPTGSVCQTTHAGGALVCYPLCQSDSDCPSLHVCDRYTGTSGPPPASEASLLDIGAACTNDGQCRSSFCIVASLAPGGYCTAFCSLSLQGCPTGSHCTANWTNVGDEGICYATCNSAADCRTGYKCGAYPGDPQLVCAPAP